MSAQDRGARARHAERGLRLVVPGDPTQPVAIEHPYLRLIGPRTADTPPMRAEQLGRR